MKSSVYSMFVSFLIIEYITYSYSLRYGCPTNRKVINNLSPCDCSQKFEKTNWKTVVDCSGFNDNRKLRLSLNAIHGYKIDELLLYGLNMDYLPEDVFIDKDDNNKVLVEIETVTIRKSIIEDIAGPLNPYNEKRSFFTGLGSSMRELKIESSRRVAQFNWTRLADSLSEPPLKEGTSLALKNLLFYDNEMKTLPLSFDSLGDETKGLSPERVILQWNSIRKIESFLLFPKMKVLDLSWNQIESLGNLFNKSDNGVEGLKNIETIILKNNKLTVLDQNDQFWKLVIAKNGETPQTLSYIDLRENQIDCKCKNIEWTRKAKLIPIIDAKCSSPPEVSGKSLDSCPVDLYYNNMSKNFSVLLKSNTD